MTKVTQNWIETLRVNFWNPHQKKNQSIGLRFTIPVLRIIYAIWRDWWRGELTLRAMSLVYTTLLSLVPLLAVSFSVLKAFGVHNQIEKFLQQALLPLGEQGVLISSKIISFVDNMQVGVLGTLGLAMLFYTVIALMQKIESAFNYTWHVAQDRGLGQRFSYYLSTIMIGPVLVFAAISISISLLNSDVAQQLLSIDSVGYLLSFLTRLIPTFMIIGAFTFLYILIPNTNVSFRSALIGAIVAGLLWQAVGYLFASLVVGSAKYTAIYSALASLIFFMVWLYVGWMIVLIGASIAHYHQNPESLLIQSRSMKLSHHQKRNLCIHILIEIQRTFSQGKKGIGNEKLADDLCMPQETMSQMLELLYDAHMVVFIDEEQGWKPSRDLSQISIAEIYREIDNSLGQSVKEYPQTYTNPKVIEWEKIAEDSINQSLGNRYINEALNSESQNKDK